MLHDDINRYASHKHFLPVLDDKIRNCSHPTDALINALSSLKAELNEQGKNIIANLWCDIAKKKLQMSSTMPEKLNEPLKTILANVNCEYQKKLVSLLCQKIQNTEISNGKTYYNEFNDLDTFINQYSVEVKDYIGDLEVEPNVFVEYVAEAKGNYPAYKLKTIPEKLDDFFANSITQSEKLAINIEFLCMANNILPYLINDKSYGFNSTFSVISEIIKGDAQGQIINANNFKELLDIYKILSTEKPLHPKLNSSHRNNIYNSLLSNKKTDTDDYLEIVTIQISESVNVSGKFDENQIKCIAENIEYYATYGDLLIKCTQTNILILNQALNYLTTKTSLDRSTLDIHKILPLFETIKNQINVTTEELLNQLDGWHTQVAQITSSEIESIIPQPQFFQYSTTTKNRLTDHLNRIAVEALSKVSSDTLYQQRHSTSYYWITVLKHLIDTDFLILTSESDDNFLHKLPENVNEFGKKILEDIATGTQLIPTPENLFQKIIDKLDKETTATLIIDIRNIFCNNKNAMNERLFIYLEPWFKEQGDLCKRSADVVHYILEPVIEDVKCLEIITSEAKADYYAKIVEDASDAAFEFKNKIKEMLKTNNDDKLVEFANQIGV